MPRRKPARFPNLKGVGVDLVDALRIQTLIRRHKRSACGRILTAEEKRVWRLKRYSSLVYSKFFAAKESLFKALNRSGLGMDGFQSMQIRLRGRSQFYAALKSQNGDFKQGHEGRFFIFRKRWIAAQVRIWN